MDWFRSNFLFGVVLLLLGAMAAAEVWLWSLGRQQSVRVLAALEQAREERGWLARQSPALSEENERAIVHDLDNARNVVAALRSALQGQEDVPPAESPARAVDLYFDIAAFVEKTRALAGRAQVGVNPDERFGFASHVNEGPEADLVAAVLQQRAAVQCLVEALLETQPRSVSAVQRERPLTAAARTARNHPAPAAAAMPPGGMAGQAADFFDFDPALSVRVPGQIDSDAFRLEFTGQTAALRGLLNTLAALKRPVIVRSVEVGPLEAGVVASGPPVPPAPVPLVAQNLSRFAVLVEFVRLVPAAEGARP